MDSPPSPPSPPRYSASYCDSHKSKSSSRRSPSLTSEHRSSRRNSSPRRRRRGSGSRSPRRSYSGERSGRSSRHTSSRRERSRSRSRSRRSRSRNRSRERQRPRESTRHRHHRTPSHEAEPPRSNVAERVAPFVPAPYPVQSNAFKNDGSFMEMFKRMQEQMNQQQVQQQQQQQQSSSVILEEKPVAPPPLMVGKRRGGRILKTGMVAKPKVEQTPEQPKDAWSLYMAEVKKYREVCCQEEDNTRPLVK